MKSVSLAPKKLSGKIEIPPSKSLCHRAVICASLCKGQSVIENVDYSDDVIATINAMRSFGAQIREYDHSLVINGSDTFTKTGVINCLESGSTLRFLIPLALHAAGPSTFIGEGRLIKRPLTPFYDIFDYSGIDYATNNGELPLKVCGGTLPRYIEIEGNVSSQFISGLLFSLPLFDFDSEIRITTPFESKPYIDLTIEMMEKFGVTVYNNNYNTIKIRGNQQYTACNCTIEGDFSQAAFYLVAGTLGNFVVCRGLNMLSNQGDKEMVNIIRKMGGKVVIEGDGIMALPSRLKGRKIDASQIPDLVPALALLGAFAEGETRITNASRLRIKESDRLSAVTNVLNTLGATIIEKKDGLVIEGCKEFGGGTVTSENDHRIAMMVAIASTVSNSVIELKNSDCVKKSYPEFWKDFQKLGGEFDEWDLGEEL